ncbi:Hypothetical predicted protein, partial [Pelobates cultripes]
TTASPQGKRKKGTQALCKTLANTLTMYNLYDSWRTQHPTDRDYTFYSRVHNTYTRIDTFFIDNKTLPQLTDCRIGEITWSDHSPIYLDVEDTYQSRGRSTWRLNESLLLDKPFVECMKIELSEYFLANTTGEVTDYTVWSAHKAVMRGQFIRQSAYIKRHHQTTLLECHKQIAINTAQNKKTPTAALADKLR